MEYILSGTCIAICIMIIVFGLKVLKETQNMSPKKSPLEEDEEEFRRRR